MQNRFFQGLRCPRLLLFVCVLTAATSARAQSRLSGNFQQSPLATAFYELEKNSGITISYDPLVVENLRVTAVFTDKKIEEAFDLLLRGTPLQAEVLRERHVLVSRRPEPAPLLQLCGRLIDAQNGEPLEYAAVFAEKTKVSVFSGADGRFSLQASSSDTVQLRLLGFQTLRLPAQRLQKPCADIRLPARHRELVEITITDRAVEPLGLPKGNGGAELRPDRGGFVPSLGEPDPFRLIQFLPGVTADGDKADKLLVRGGSNDQNMVLWEGIPVYHTGHLFGVVSALNPYMVDRVSIWKGNFSADQGGRVSSIIDMRTAARTFEKPTLSAGLNLVSAYFSLETPLFGKKAGLLVAGRRAFSDVLENPAYQKLFGFATQNSRIRNDQDEQQSNPILLNAYRIRPSSAFGDGNFKFFWQPNERTRLEASGYAGTDGLRYRRDVVLPEWNFYFAGGDTVNVRNLGFSVRLQRQWTPDYASEWRFAWSDYQSLYNFSGTFDTLEAAQYIHNQENTLREGTFQFNNTWRLSARHHLQFGFQAVKTANYFFQKALSRVQPQDSWEWSNDVPSNQSALYGIWRMGDSTHWMLETGVRHVTFNYATRSYWEPRLSAQRELRPGLRLKINGGIFHQFMRQAYIWNDLGLNNEAWFTADDNFNLPVLESRQVSAGFSFARNGWLFDVEAYHKFLDNLTGVNFRFNGEPESLWDVRGVETARGVEVLLRKKWGPYTHWLSYTYGRAEMRFDSLNAGSIFPADFDQRHAFGWAHHLRWKHWSLALSWNFHSGRPYSPPTGITIVTEPDGNKRLEVAYGPRNSGRLPNYHRLDASVQYHFSQKKINGSAGLSVFNAANRVNLQNREFYVETKYDDAGNPVDYGVGGVDRTLLGRMVNVFVLLRL